MRSSWLYQRARNVRGTGLDLASVGCNSQVSDGDVLGLTGTVRNHATVLVGCASSIASRVSVSEPIWFTFTSRALARPLRYREPDAQVGHEQVVTDDLEPCHRSAQGSCSPPSRSRPGDPRWKPGGTCNEVSVVCAHLSCGLFWPSNSYAPSL